jgi:hypothetical protein
MELDIENKLVIIPLEELSNVDFIPNLKELQKEVRKRHIINTLKKVIQLIESDRYSEVLNFYCFEAGYNETIDFSLYDNEEELCIGGALRRLQEKEFIPKKKAKKKPIILEDECVSEEREEDDYTHE